MFILLDFLRICYNNCKYWLGIMGPSRITWWTIYILPNTKHEDCLFPLPQSFATFGWHLPPTMILKHLFKHRDIVFVFSKGNSKHILFLFKPIYSELHHQTSLVTAYFITLILLSINGQNTKIIAAFKHKIVLI